MEGFQAEVLIEDLPYQIRVMGRCLPAPETKKHRGFNEKSTTIKFREDWRIKEERRIWRVIYYHLKSVFEAADSGVMEFRALMLPYLVTKNGQTIAEHIVPQLAAVVAGSSIRMLGTGE
jgi:hypothetical protein